MAALTTRVPCNILTGPLGAGKSTAILKLLQARGDGNWAVLVNEMGDVGIDGVIAGSGGAATAEVSGGCICCANGVAVRVALTRLLKKRPSRLLIEPSGLGHVAELSEHLQKEPLSNALELRAVACVVPCDRHALLWAEAPLYRDMVHASDLLILNRRDVDASLTSDVDAWARELYPPKTVLLADRGACANDWVDSPRDAVTIEQEHAPGAEEDDEYRPKRTFTHIDGSKRTESHGGGKAYVGVIFGKLGAPFEADRLESACATACAFDGAERFKGVFYVRTQGWVLVQWVRNGGLMDTQILSRAADSRFQLILCGDEPAPVAVAALESAFMGARGKV